MQDGILDPGCVTPIVHACCPGFKSLLSYMGLFLHSVFILLQFPAIRAKPPSRSLASCNYYSGFCESLGLTVAIGCIL